MRSVQPHDFDTAVLIANEQMDETERLRAEYEARLAAAHRIIAEQVEVSARLFAALIGITSHLAQVPGAVSEQVREAISLVGGSA